MTSNPDHARPSFGYKAQLVYGCATILSSRSQSDSDILVILKKGSFVALYRGLEAYARDDQFVEKSRSFKRL